MPEGTLGDEGRRPCTDMVDQRSLTNKAMVLHLLQDRLTSGYLPKQWGHKPHALLMTSEDNRIGALPMWASVSLDLALRS